MSAITNDLLTMQNNTAQMNFQAGQDRVAQGNKELDNQAFLQLLLTQLRHQDPSNPMDQSQFLQQQASFTQIEKLQNLTSAIENNNTLMQASNLVGKSVAVTDSLDNVRQINVDSVMFDDTGQVLLRNGEDTYPASSIIEIFDAQPPADA